MRLPLTPGILNEFQDLMGYDWSLKAGFVVFRNKDAL